MVPAMISPPRVEILNSRSDRDERADFVFGINEFQINTEVKILRCVWKLPEGAEILRPSLRGFNELLKDCVEVKLVQQSDLCCYIRTY
jgi:hypothetical protein